MAHDDTDLGILERNLAGLEAEIASACGRAGRPRGSVTLLPVVKYVGTETLRLLHRAGVRDAGEGTVQGALEKREALERELPDLHFHLVGHLQRNKARKAVRLFRTVHSLDSLRLAERLEEELRLLEAGEEAARAVLVPRLPRFFIEVNIAGEVRKGGVPPGGIGEFLAGIRGMPRVAARIEGLMAMAPAAPDPEAARPWFRALRELRDRLVANGSLPAGAGLSMGMSDDFPVAIEEGATTVRVGSRIFRDLPCIGGPPGHGGLPWR